MEGTKEKGRRPWLPGKEITCDRLQQIQLGTLRSRGSRGRETWWEQTDWNAAT
jgi:hypothetical protein